MKRRFGMSLIMLLGLALVSSAALAWDHGHDRDRDRDDRKEARDRDHDGDRHRGRGDRDEDRGDRDGRGEPRGWSHGRKEGWKKSDCDLPPGLAKKNPDCGESWHDRDRDRDRDRVVVGRTPSSIPTRSRTTIVHTPLGNTVPTSKPRTVARKPTHKIRNPAEMIDPKTGKPVR